MRGVSVLKQIGMGSRPRQLQFVAGNSIDQEPIRLQVEIAVAFPIGSQGMVVVAGRQGHLRQQQVENSRQFAEVLALLSRPLDVSSETARRREPQHQTPKSFIISAVLAKVSTLLVSRSRIARRVAALGTLSEKGSRCSSAM